MTRFTRPSRRLVARTTAFLAASTFTAAAMSAYAWSSKIDGHCLLMTHPNGGAHMTDLGWMSSWACSAIDYLAHAVS